VAIEFVESTGLVLILHVFQQLFSYILAPWFQTKQPCSLNECITYFIEGWSILQHDLNNIQEVFHFEHCVNL
jgi:hypothetical protein